MGRSGRRGSSHLRDPRRKPHRRSRPVPDYR
jgi:hypothetical protein